MNAPGQPPSSNSNVLAGWNIVVTRPRDGAAALVSGLRRHGARVLRLPAQSIVANPDFDWSAALAARDRIDNWLFTSPSAVRHAGPLLESGLPAGRVFAVGSATAGILRRHGIDAIAPDLQHTSEGLLENAGLIDVRVRRIAIVTAPGGRGLIAKTLRERGADVFEWPVYRREPAAWSKRQIAALMAASGPLLTIITSAEAVDLLAARLPNETWQRLRNAQWLVSSARLRDALHVHGVTQVRVTASALARELVDAACEYR